MRKRLALVICLLMVSLLGFIGCKEEPYADMTIKIEGASTESVQQLLIEREVQGSGEISYTYPTVEFTVKVENYGDADPNIKVSGWEGYINEPKITYLGDGVSQVSSQVLSYDATGKFTLSIMTNEGNKSAALKYEVDLKLDSFEINADKLQAVSTSYEICLDDIGGLITYYPENSTQKDIEYTVALPITQYGDGYSIDGKWVDEDAVYFMDQDLLNYLAAGYKYAEVKVNKDTGRQTLHVYPYFLDATGELARDTEGNPIPSIYPSVYEETTGEGINIEIDMITLKATSKAVSIPEFIDIEVVESAGEAHLQMNAQMTEIPININRDKNNEYNVVLVDPDFKGGVVSAGAMSYYTERDLLFYVEGLVGGADNLLEEYYVVAENVSANDEKAVDISMIGDANQFKIHALAEGKYTHKFTLTHSKYPGLFDEEIVVNFKVIKMPFNIDVNGFNLEIGSVQTIPYSVYNVYPRTSYGTKFKVNTLSQFDYFVYLESEDENYKNMVDNLILRRDGDGEQAVFASMAGVDAGMSSLGSTVEGVPFTTFNKNSAFFLSHKFAELPTEYLTIYIGISFAVSDESYTEEVASNFLDLTLIYPIMLNIENGIDKIAVTKDSYKVNLSDNMLEYALDEEGGVADYDAGIKLWEMPAGKTIENSIKSITYDEDLIKVYSFTDAVTQVTTLYIKYVKDATVGETEIVIETLNQLVKTVKVETFVPTIYQHNGDLSETSPKMPLSVDVDEESSAFLFYMSGRSENNASAQWELYTSPDVASGKYYDSVRRLFMITNATQKITIYDYMVKTVGGRTVITPIDVTDKVSVTFSYPNYAKYENGIITTNSLITYSITAPIVMTIKYSAGYEYFDLEGNLVYDLYEMTHTVDLFIYERLQGVEVLTAKAVDLYVQDSLGYYDKALANHTIVSTYIPHEVKLGAEWNGAPEFAALNMEPVKLWYDYDVIRTNIIGDNGSEIRIKSLVDGQYRVIKYEDLFTTEINDDNYELTVTSVISDELLEWFGNNGYGNDDAIENILQEHIFNNTIHFVVNVYITQFRRLQNVNQIKFTAKYAAKTTGLKLDVEDDGVYFEVRKDANGDWELSKDRIVVPYTITHPGSVGSEVVLANEETLFYSAEVIADSTGTSGIIIITPKLTRGVGYLVVTTKDNINNVVNTDIDYYNDNSVLSFRVKVADGSKGFEFEIANADDYQRMYATTTAGYYYQYIITRDINLKGYNVSGLSILNTPTANKNNTEFCLSGKHTYFKNSNEIIRYNSIYNLEIDAVVNYDTAGIVNIGLFGQISDCVTLDNVFIKNSSIVITENAENKRDFNVGLLVGWNNGATINSCSINGSIKFVRNSEVAKGYIGGMVGLVSSGTIANLPGNYETGVVSTGNNAYIDIELTSDDENIITSATLTADKTVAGGLVGVANNAEINKQQIVSNITTVIRSAIGGIVGAINAGTGSTNKSTIASIDVSPRLIANLQTTATGSNTGLYVGSIIGLSNTSYSIQNSLVNYVDIGNESGYVWEDRVNTLVYALNEKVAVGGLVGGDENNTATRSNIQTTYARSYYKRIIDEDYAGNIYVIAGAESSIGGLVGHSKSPRLTVNKAYFDGNITALNSIKNIGMLLGSIPSVTGLVMSNVYGIGLNYEIALVDENTDTVPDVDANGKLITVLTPVADINKLAIASQGSTWTTGAIPLINNYENTQTLALDNISMSNVYVVVNEKATFFGEGTQLYYVDSLTAMLSVVGEQSTIFGFLTNKLNYSITNGENKPLSNADWFWHAEINTSTVGANVYAFPVLVNGNLIMYDLVPTKIDVMLNERDGLYNINYTEGEITTNQVIMYINRDKNGQIADDCYYEMSLDNENSAFVISLKGGVEINTTYVNTSNLKVNDKIEFLESSDGTIIEIVGNRIYPVTTGTVTLTIRSYVAKSIKAIITIVVVDGITDYEFIYEESKTLENVKFTIQGDKIITDNVVYVDELTEFNLFTHNNLKGNKYLANTNIGFILEILDASEGGTIDNGIIKINGIEYSYVPDSPLDNIFVFNVSAFKVSGVYIGNVNFAITPFINLNSVTYVDTYHSVGVDGEDNHSTKALNNVYILDGETVATSNLQKTYELAVRARAKGVTTSVNTVEIDATNVVSFNVIIETANVKVYETGTFSPAPRNYPIYNVVILEDLLIQINGRKFNAPLVLTNSVFECEYINGKFVCMNFNIPNGLAFDYTLINILFNSMSITKTNVDAISRNNTYKITLGANIRFDREFYRANANSYDLNTVLYNISFIPTSNHTVVSESQLVANIVPSEIRTIFTNFYSKGVDKEFSAQDPDIEYEYPEYNDTSFIVPGRDGLLKITTDEEFNNSSYMTISLNKEYLGYVTLQQLAGLVSNESNIGLDGFVPEIVGYKHVSSLEYFETASTFGIKLSKLSLNCMDNHYFNNTYFIKVLAVKDIVQSDVVMQIASYKVDRDNNKTLQITKEVSLKVMELPQLKVTVDGDDYAVMGKGVVKELDIFYKGLTKDINLISPIEDTDTILNTDTTIDYMYVADDEGNRVVGKLSLEYLDAGRKYYLYQDVTTKSGSSWTIGFNAYETILGAIEECKSNLIIDTVDFEIDRVEVCGSATSEINILHGQTTVFDTQIVIKDIVVGDKDKIEEFEKSLYEKTGFVTATQYAFAGTSFKKYESETETVYSDGTSYLQERKLDGEDTIYVDISVAKEESKRVGSITFTRRENKDDNLHYMYYEITGTSIGRDTYIRLDVDYYFDANGHLVVGNDADVLYVYNYTVDLLIIVNDNSTYDHPTPIETQEDLFRASSVVNGNFILLNNITLVNWQPQEALFDTLDGNGYTITIESLDLSSVWGEKTADVGIFSKVSKETMLKNMTIDVSPLLITETDMLNAISQMRASSEGTYVHSSSGIDLGYIPELNFGILAGVNDGAITNAKIITTSQGDEGDRLYLHVQTTLGYMDSKLVTSNIGGLVGQNSATGAISNSFVGISINGVEGTDYYIETIKNASSMELNNSTDNLVETQIYPFVLAGGNNIAGMAAINDGVISNSYTKGLGVYNSFPTVGESATAGLVVTNNNLISSTFVEGNDIEGYRAKQNKFMLESTGYIGGLVYENNAKIENSYTNVYLQTLSSFLGGFVYTNNKGATIKNAYSTAVNKNSLATGQFTGVKQGVVQNFGTYENCYYLVEYSKYENIKEKAQAIIEKHDDGSVMNPYDEVGSWSGFSFVSGVNVDGIWSVAEGKTPRIDTTLTDTVSFRELTDIEFNEAGGGTVYNYKYNEYYLGTKQNPLLIEKAENFDKYIIDSSFDHGTGSKIFGYGSSEYTVKHVRIVNNLNFESITTAKEYDGTYLYKVVFCGILDGNGMTLSNLNINTDSTNLDNFGLFAQIGYDTMTTKSVVKNFTMNLRTYKSTGNSSAGVLAGTIVNSSIINVKINGNGQTVRGINTAGALAGTIYSTNDISISLIDIDIENIIVEATYSSLGGTLNARSEDKGYFFKELTVESEGTQSTFGHTFKSLYNSNTKTTNVSLDERKKVSYAGIAAGVLVAHNSNKTIEDGNTINEYRTNVEESTINNIVVKGDVSVGTADNAGGVFGYVGENTLVRNSKLIVTDKQLLKGFNNIGGIVGENHGIIELCSVAYDEEKQAEFDATLLNNDVSSGTFNLFDKSSGEPYYVVSIGGIAGKSENGIIIDSYTTVNVVKSLSYIAGGIVGYTEGDNYLGYVYNTGTVLGLYVVGGVVGFQVNDMDDDTDTFTNKLVMETVVSLTNWNAANNTNDAIINVRDIITARLFENTKSMYINAGAYYNYYFKMPEIGNAPINYIDATATDVEESYRTGHTAYYVGSVVGKVMFREDDFSILNSSGSTVEQNSHVIYDNELIADLYEDSSNVFSSTLGLSTISGDVESGSRIDDYFKTSFVVAIGQDLDINSLSYRIAYRENVDGNTLNKYELINSTAETGTAYIDKFDFNQVFTSQEYRQQLLGKSYDGAEFGPNGEVVVPSKSTKNIFSNGYNSNRSSAGTGGGQFVDGTTLVWEMQNLESQGLQQGIRPVYANKVKVSREKVDNAISLSAAFSNSASGKTYEIINDIEINVINAGRDRFVEYFGGVKSMFIGAKPDGADLDTAPDRPTITINMIAENASNEDNNLASIFNLWSGATFDNIKYVINIDKSNFTELDVQSQSYGLLANALDSVYITNCEFVINVDNRFVISADGVGASPSVHAYQAESAGVLFGSIENSQIENTTFDITVNGVTINHEKVANLGMLAGKITGSSISNCTFELGNINILTKKSAETLNIGAIAGTVVNSKISRNSLILGSSIDNKLQVTDEYDNLIKNIGGMFGYSATMNFAGFNASAEVTAETNNYLMNVEYIANANLTLDELNMASMIAKSNSSRLDNYIVKHAEDADSDSVYSINARNNGKTILVNNLSVGSVIGYDVTSSQIGRSGGVGNNVDIITNISSYSANIGGVVGYTTGSNQLMSNTFYNGEIRVTNSLEGKSESKVINDETVTIITTADTNVGGLVGLNDGYSVLSSVLSSGIISVTTADNITPYTNTALGGLVGRANGNTKIENFASIGTLDTNKDTMSDTYGKVYVSGVIGCNNAIFTGSNGYTYIELPDKSFGEVSAISSGIVSIMNNSVFYAQEFIGNNYINDSKGVGYAMGDLYNTVSEYSLMYSLNLVDGMKLDIVGKVQLFVPTVALGRVNVTNQATLAKFNPSVITASTGLNANSYYVITSNLDNVIFEEIPSGSVVSGRTLENGKVTLTANAPTNHKFIAKTNNGVLSNIYVNVGASNVANKITLTDTNNGLITNCYVYGLSKANYAFATTNNGKIYSSASAIKLVSVSESKLFAYVKNNNSDGEIIDCYSSSFGYSSNDKHITNVSMVESNSGLIQNSAYYVPESMKYDNKLVGYVEGTNDGEIKSCYNNILPNSLISRKTKFYEENSHVQILGFKDVPGTILIRIYITVGGNTTEIASVADMQTKIAQYVFEGTTYELSYEYDFYVSDAQKPVYNVVRICNSDGFTNYIDSLTGGYIPEETIILLTNDLSKSTNNHIIKMNASKLNTINVSKNSAIIGINTNGENSNIILDFNDGSEVVGGVTVYAQQKLMHEFISDNRGVVVGLNIHDAYFYTISENTTVGFAPIVTNSGVIDNVNLRNVTVTTAVRSHVAGLIANNTAQGKVANCEIVGLGLSSRRYVNYICTSNNGYIANTVRCVSASHNGNIYNGGV